MKYRRWHEASLLLRVTRTQHDASTERLREVNTKYKEQAALIRDLLEAQARMSEADYQYQQALSSYWGALAGFFAARWGKNNHEKHSRNHLGGVDVHGQLPFQQAARATTARRPRRDDQAASSVSDGLRFSAVVTPYAQVALAFRIPGYVTSLKQVRADGAIRDIAEGDSVSKGAPLAHIRATEYADRVHQATSEAEAAKAAAVKAQLDFDRASRLYEAQSLTKPEFEAARAQHDGTQAQLRVAQAQTAEAQVSLGDTTLVAPFSGDIVKKSVELGAFVGPGAPAFALASTDVVKIVIGVPDTAVRSIKVGQPVDIAIEAFPSRTFHARISRISSAADTTTRNFDVEVAIPNHDHMLKVGMIGSLQWRKAKRQARSGDFSAGSALGDCAGE